MTFNIKKTINTIKINEDYYELVELEFRGELPSNYSQSKEDFENSHRYATMKKSDIGDHSFNLGDALPSSTIHGAVENRYSTIRYAEIMEKYGFDYNHPDCLKELKEEMSRKKKYRYMLSIDRGTNVHGQTMWERAYFNTIDNALFENMFARQHGHSTLPIIMMED